MILKNILKQFGNFHGTDSFDKGDLYLGKLKNDRIENQMIHLLDGSIDTGPILLHDNSIYPSYCKVPYDFENTMIKAT